MAKQVVTVTAASRPTAVIAATTTWPEYPQLWRKLLDQVHANVRWGGAGRAGRNVMLYHDAVPNIEIGVELDQPAEIAAPVVRSTLPAGEVAMTVHYGPYELLGDTHDTIIDWCDEHGRHRAGPRWEIYGHWVDDPDLLETEVYYLLG